MNGKMGYRLHSLSLEKVEKVTLTQFFEHYQNVCQAIGCLMLSLLTMLKLKSMCWSLISLNLHTIPCLLHVYCNAYFVAKPNSLTNHSLLHIIFWHKLCLFYKALICVKACSISCLLDIHKHSIRLLEKLILEMMFSHASMFDQGPKFFFMFVACAQNMSRKCYKKSSNSRRLNKSIICFGLNNVFKSLSTKSWSHFVGATINRHHGKQVPQCISIHWISQRPLDA